MFFFFFFRAKKKNDIPVSKERKEGEVLVVSADLRGVRLLPSSSWLKPSRVLAPNPSRDVYDAMIDGRRSNPVVERKSKRTEVRFS